MTSPTEPADDTEDRDSDEAPTDPDSDRRRPARGRGGRPARPRGERSPEWPYAPPAREDERSPEWPYAPPSERRERTAPERREEPLPRWGLQARPDVDVAERPDELHVWCDLPGCAEETIELSGDEWTLYVSAERAEEYWEEGGIQRRERSRRAERSISLPARSDIDAAEATFEDGVLFVRAPKHESERTQTIGFE